MPQLCGAHDLFLKMLALLAGCLDHVEHRLTPAFKVECAAAVSELGVVGDVIVAAVVASRGLAARCVIHAVLADVNMRIW